MYIVHSENDPNLHILLQVDTQPCLQSAQVKTKTSLAEMEARRKSAHFGQKENRAHC